MLSFNGLSKTSLSELLILQLVSSEAGGKRRANLSAMLLSRRILCPCVINPEDNSNELKKLIYFNRKYQVRHIAFVRSLMSSFC